MAAAQDRREEPVSFVCPACRRTVRRVEKGYSCAACARLYPILYGIPDFRLRSDCYLSMEDERRKAARLHECAGSFDQLLDYYYAITEDVSPALAVRYKAYAKNGPERASAILADLALGAPSAGLIDLGCGTGGVLIAASGYYKDLVGVDIALRWLVLCQRRLLECGVRALLVCADVERLPFAKASFGHAVAADLIEHVYEPDRALAEVARVLRRHGLLWLSASNRLSPGPHPPTGIWGVGYLPEYWRRPLVRRLRGVDSLRYTHLLSPGCLARKCRAQGLHPLSMRPKRVPPEAAAGLPPLERVLFGFYRSVAETRKLQHMLTAVAPAFELLCRKQDAGHARGHSVDAVLRGG